MKQFIPILIVLLLGVGCGQTEEEKLEEAVDQLMAEMEADEKREAEDQERLRKEGLEHMASLDVEIEKDIENLTAISNGLNFLHKSLYSDSLAEYSVTKDASEIELAQVQRILYQEEISVEMMKNSEGIASLSPTVFYGDCEDVALHLERNTAILEMKGPYSHVPPSFTDFLANIDHDELNEGVLILNRINTGSWDYDDVLIYDDLAIESGRTLQDVLAEEEDLSRYEGLAIYDVLVAERAAANDEEEAIAEEEIDVAMEMEIPEEMVDEAEIEAEEQEYNNALRSLDPNTISRLSNLRYIVFSKTLIDQGAVEEEDDKYISGYLAQNHFIFDLVEQRLIASFFLGVENSMQLRIDGYQSLTEAAKNNLRWEMHRELEECLPKILKSGED